MKTAEVIHIYLTEHDLKQNSVNHYKWLESNLLSSNITEWFDNHRQILEFLKSRNIKPISQVQMLKRIRAICGYLERAYDIPDPTKKIERGAIKVTRPEMPFLDEFQMMKCIQACKNTLERISIMVSIETGARASEMANFRLQDLRENEIKSFDQGKTGFHLYSCSPELVSIIRDYCAETNPEFILCTPITSTHKRKDESLARTQQLERRIGAILRRTGLITKKFGPHIFRRSTGSLVAGETRSVLEVMKHLQQADMNTAMIYIRDAEARSSQHLSPLNIIAKKVTGQSNSNVTQLTLSDSQTIILADGTEIKQSDNSILFQLPPDFQTIRPRLTRTEMEIIATAFTALTDKIQYGKASSDCKAFWDRMLRKQ